MNEIEALFGAYEYKAASCYIRRECVEEQSLEVSRNNLTGTLLVKTTPLPLVRVFVCVCVFFF